MKESQLLSYTLKRCWAERSWLTVDRINAGQVMVSNSYGVKRPFKGAKKGTADIIGFFAPYGRFLALECKTGTKQSAEQIEFEKDVKAKGGEYFVIHNAEELDAVLKQLKPGVPL
jgi:hypothetical protein